MRYGIVGDVHGREIGPVRERFRAARVDEGICLGDFDRAFIARQMMNLQEREDWYVVPGNHDHSHVYKIEITSGTMRKQGIDSRMMWVEWDLPENKDVNAYVKTLLNSGPSRKNCGRKLDVEIGGQKAIIIHGALAGDSGDYQNESADIWTRLRTSADHAANFKEMEKNDYQIMIRGHDHTPAYTYKDPVKGIKSYDGTDDAKFRLFKNRLHTINPGAYFEGNFAIIDTDVKGEDCPVLEYHKL